MIAYTSIYYTKKQIKSVRMNEKCLWLTFRKISAKDPHLEGKKIEVVLETSRNTYKLKSSRSVKNGIANFYGQSFALPLQTAKFTMSVQEETKHQKLKPICQFLVPKEQISEFTSRKNIFISDSDSLKVTWEGQILDQNQEQFDEYSDRSELDFEDFEEQEPRKNEILYRKAYSPLIRHLHQKKHNKKSFRLRNQETASQPPSQSPYKFTLEAKDMHNRVVKKKQTLESTRKIDEVSFNYSCSEDDAVHSIFKQKKANKKIEKKYSAPLYHYLLSPQPSKQKTHQIKKKCIFQRLNLRNIVCSGVIGLIGGLTATQL